MKLRSLWLLAFFLAACSQPSLPDFALRAEPSSLVLHPGEAQTLTLAVSPEKGFGGTLELSLENAPAGLTLSPTTIRVPSNAPSRHTLTLKASENAVPGEYAFDLKARADKLSRQVRLKLTLWPPAGTLDAAFGDNGVAVVKDALQAQGAHDAGHSLAVDAEGRILVLGESADSTGNQRLVVVRFTSEGRLDPSFGAAGVALGPTIRLEARYDLDRALSVAEDGSVLFAGYTSEGASGEDAVLCRLHADGSPDSGFGDRGCARFDSLAGGNGNDRAYTLFQRDGEAFFGGFSFRSPEEAVNAFLAKALPDGRLDFSFAEDGVLEGGNEDYDAVYSLAADDGGLFAAGTTKESGVYLMLLAKVTEDGAFDAGFGKNGVVFLGGLGGGEDDRAYAVRTTADGRAVLAGHTDTEPGREVNLDVAVVVLEPDGNLAQDFAEDGILVLGQLGGGKQNGGDMAYSLALDPKGRILVAGETYVQTDTKADYDLFVLRLLPDGRLDPSFAQDGVFVWDGGYGDDRAFEVALDQKGRILIAGATTGPDGDLDLVLLRLAP